ncbi:hypothetical protein D499_0C00870 [Hanseniaspora uvarum DSM 2768]|nr:hypothetical protein D499_0C00870 [Hanseniaspora uvarum DSM 2768]
MSPEKIYIFFKKTRLKPLLNSMHFNNWKDVLEYYELPHVSNDLNIDKEVKDIHIYDFDGTMFYSPSISNDIFTEKAKNYLIPFKGMKNSGGWWCYQFSLETYINDWIKEKSAFSNTTSSSKGECYCDQCKIDHKYWSYDIIKKINISYEQKDCLTVMMTGRREDKFQDTFIKLLKSEVSNRVIFHNELKFDCIFLKKDYKYTMQYKLNVITNFIYKFPKLRSILMYDDRTDQIVGMEAWWKKQPKKIKFKIIPVIAKVGKYENNQQLQIVQNLISTHNRNTPEQIMDVNVSISDDIYYAIDKGISRFLSMYLKFDDWNYKQGILGIQMIEQNPITGSIEWVISKFKMSKKVGYFIELYNKQNINQKSIIITHYKESHLKTYEEIIKNDLLNKFDEEIDINYDFNEDHSILINNNDKMVKSSEKIDLNRELQLTFLNLNGSTLSFENNMSHFNNFMIIDLYEV